jgi:SAM-dependent methyltransferase
MKNESAIIHQNISYYNEIAGQYDQIMDADSSNELVRRKLKEKLRSLLLSGRVVDFGGGTGLDLEWLTAAGYTIYFCEPSEAMRKKAMALNNFDKLQRSITFLETEKTDFTKWDAAPPFPGKADALIANFGVLNYIPDLGSLFQNLANVLKPGAPLLLVILKMSFRRRLKWHRRNALWSLLTGTTFVMYITHNNERQTVFVYTAKKIERAAARWFEFRESEPVTGFSLLHLTRK